MNVSKSYRSKLWIETEGHWDHQAQDDRSANVTYRSHQQGAPLQKPCPEMTEKRWGQFVHSLKSEKLIVCWIKAHIVLVVSLAILAKLCHQLLIKTD
jgi:hypothetical protein